MNVNSTNPPRIFNHPERFIEGWYWVMPSHTLQVGEVKAVTILGRELAIYRGKDKRAVTVDAYCPHMGTHLGEGTVEENQLRCYSHHWQFDAQGICVHIPCLNHPLSLKLKTWPTAEKYGLIWIWTGELPKQPLPFIVELEQKDFNITLGSEFIINCHAHVLMINSIDAQHLNILCRLKSPIKLEKQEINQNAIVFNSTKNIDSDLLLFLTFFKNYNICYWYGSTAIVTLKTHFFRVYVLLAVRLLPGRMSTLQVVLMVEKSPGIFLSLWHRITLWLSKIWLNLLIGRIIKIKRRISFNLKTPIQVDQPMVDFINHLEQQKPLMWGTWRLARSQNAQIKESHETWRDHRAND